MKKHSKSKPKKTSAKKPGVQPKVIGELAQHFEVELNKKMPLAVQPNGSIVYKDFLVKEIKTGNWGVYNLKSRDIIDQFYLKTCALMAAKAYANANLEKFFEIKDLDNKYWANFCDSLVFRNNIKTAKEYNRYLILLTRLEHSDFLAGYYKDKISTMFKWSFV
jgi:hypothetical protein